MIYSFSCDNYRNVNVSKLNFKRINLLIGPNNSGKSNFIKALTFYSNMLKYPDAGDLNTAFYNAVKRNGWDHISNYNGDDKRVNFTWEMGLNGNRVNYDFSFIPGKTVENCFIAKESMSAAQPGKNGKAFNYFSCHTSEAGQGFISTATTKGKPNSRRTFNVSNTEVFCRQYKDIFLSDQNLYNSSEREKIMKIVSDMEEAFYGIRAYSSAKMNTVAMRQPVEIKAKESVLRQDVTNFVSVYDQYKSDSLHWRRLFLEKMQALDSEFRDMDVVTRYDKQIFCIEMKNGHLFDLSDVSEGTLKALVFNLLLNMPAKRTNTLLALDEPENNLHPAWQKIIGRWLLESESFEQCFVSTHSPDFLDVFTEWFKNGEVSLFVFDGMGHVSEKRYDDIRIDLEGWELGDLYRTNDPALGGWPW